MLTVKRLVSCKFISSVTLFLLSAVKSIIMAYVNYKWPRDNYLQPDPWYNRWNGVCQGFQRTGWSTTMEVEMSQRRPARVVIAGHSFVCHLMRDVERRLGIYHNMNLEYHVAEIHVVGVSGMHISEARFDYLHQILEHNPDIVYLEIGSCDAKLNGFTAKDIVKQMVDLGNELTRLGIKRVIFGEVAHRVGKGVPKKCPDYNYKVNDVNRLLSRSFDEHTQSKCFLWRHKAIWRATKEIYLDGIHFNRLGNLRLYRSIRLAIIKSIWQIMNQLHYE